MSFRQNGVPRNSLENLSLTSRGKRVLMNSWAYVFAEEIFPAIDERPFSVLYSQTASRPNTPVNVLVGAILIKEIFGLTDDEIVEAVILDPRVQYALHTTEFAEQPISDKSLQRFRGRCAAWESVTGCDLLGDCVRSLGRLTSKLMGLRGVRKRMDSMMVAANIRTLSRVELLYTCIAGLVKRDERESVPVSPGHQHYLSPGDHNLLFYHAQGEERDQVLDMVLEDAEKLLEMKDGTRENSKEYLLLLRCLGEQTIVDGTTGRRRLRTKDEGMHSGMLQNPSDQDAAYREKAGRKYRGYVLGIEETVGENGSVITDYGIEPNNCSDSRLLRNSLERNGKQPEGTTLIADGAYGGSENTRLAEEQNVTLMTTSLTGRETDPVMADFVFNDKHDIVLRCPAGHQPWKSGLPRKDGRIRVSFRKGVCDQCPHRDECGVKFSKNSSYLTVTWAAHERAKQMRARDTEEYRLYANLRNGVEAGISTLRNRYHMDRMPVRGLGRVRCFVAGKIGAFNFQKLLNFRRHRNRCAPNPLLDGC